MSVSDAWESLEADLLGEEPDYDSEPREVDVSGRADADRHLARIERARRTLAVDEDVAHAQIEQVERWLAARREAAHEVEQWHWEILHRYMTAEAAKDPKLRTVKVPHGELKLRAQQPVWEFDGPTFLAWAMGNLPDAVRMPAPPEPGIDVKVAKAALILGGVDEALHDIVVRTAEGEIPPGVTVTPRDPKFSIVLASESTAEGDSDA